MMRNDASPLTATAVKNAQPKDKAYKLSDTGGLYLFVSPSGTKSWRYDFRLEGGQRRTLTIGRFPDISLADARDAHREARGQLAKGTDPSAAKQASKRASTEAYKDSFKAIALEWVDMMKGSKWGAGYSTRVLQRLEKHLFPLLRTRPVTEITAQELLTVLNRTRAVYTRHRLRGLAEQIFSYAIATGRAHQNPATQLKGALPAHRTKHYAAITDPAELGRLLVEIDHTNRTPVVTAALRLSILLFQRPGEIRGMRWSEINWETSTWEIPEERMKMNNAHIIYLCKQALAILEDLRPLTEHRGIYVFPGLRGASRPISSAAVGKALRDMGYDKETITPHGFRATARTLLDEVLRRRVDVIETQLAHMVRDPLRRAYNRTQYLEEREDMMQMWADYLDELKRKAQK